MNPSNFVLWTIDYSIILLMVEMFVKLNKLDLLREKINKSYKLKKNLILTLRNNINL